jgi:hypothetical protein
MMQCSILFVTARSEGTQVGALKALGFHVDHGEDVPAAETWSGYQPVIVQAEVGSGLPMLAARFRAKRHFGRRVLLALVPEATADRAKREAIHSGFDQTLLDTCDARDLAATILRLLRPYPEFRCILRSPGGRRKAA